jgi:hypothetical protein
MPLGSAARDVAVAVVAVVVLVLGVLLVMSPS